MSEGQEGPKFTQARKPEQIEKAKRLSLLKKRVLAGTLVIGAVGAAAAASSVLEQAGEPTLENFQSLEEELLKVDESKYRIRWEKDGISLSIREAPKLPSLGERKSGKDNIINLSDISAINGTPLNGNSDIFLEYSPIVIGVDPSNGIVEAPWFVLEINLKNSDQELGFISHSSATSDFIERVKDGGIAKYQEDEKGLGFGISDSGKKIPNDQIGKVEIISTQTQPNS